MATSGYTTEDEGVPYAKQAGVDDYLSIDDMKDDPQTADQASTPAPTSQAMPGASANTPPQGGPPVP
eukprot:10566298-Prorocentrum_lima.AAC.1